MKLTADKMREALLVACTALQLEPRDTAYILGTIKMGDEAADHLNSPGALAYFATEDSIVGSYYHDAIMLYERFCTEVNNVIAPLYVQPYNSCEFLIYD